MNQFVTSIGRRDDLPTRFPAYLIDSLYFPVFLTGSVRATVRGPSNYFSRCDPESRIKIIFPGDSQADLVDERERLNKSQTSRETIGPESVEQENIYAG